MQFIRQGAAPKVRLGPMINPNSASAHVPVTTITAATNDIIAIPDGATSGVDLSTRTIAHIGAGVYNISLIATDTSIPGALQIAASNTAQYRPTLRDVVVLPGQVYDSLVLGSDLLQADAQQLGGNAIGAFLSGTSRVKADMEQIAGNDTAAANLSASAQGIASGTAQAGGSTTSFRSSLSQTVNGFFVGRVVLFTSGALAGQASTITAYTGATATVSVAGLTSAPANGDSFVIL